MTKISAWFGEGTQPAGEDNQRQETTTEPIFGSVPIALVVFRLLGGNVRNDADSPPAPVELDFAVDQGENREIVAESDSLTRMNSCSDLTNNDVSGLDLLTAVHFNAASLSIGIAAVSARTLSLFMRHEKLPSADRPLNSMIDVKSPSS